MKTKKWRVVIKQNIDGNETWRYRGRLVKQDDHSITLEAFFDLETLDLHGLVLQRGDRFIETYYTDRWYNIFEIHAQEEYTLRGWYCNIATPAQIFNDRIEYRDLALDLLVFPDGSQMVLDEDEFEQLNISDDFREMAVNALSELKMLFKNTATFRKVDPGLPI
jgi:protein associated with RNAse G/E